MKLSIFSKSKIPNIFNCSYGQMDYINRKMEYNIDIYNNTIELSNRYVHKDGLLKVIHMLYNVVTLNESDALFYLNANIDGVARILGINTGYNITRPINGSIYILDTNPSFLLEDYMNISAIKPRRLSKFDLSFSHPVEFGFYGKSIYTIDIMLMMMQYRKWYISRPSLPKSPQIFLYNTIYRNLTKEVFIYSLIAYLLDIPGEYNRKNYNMYMISSYVPYNEIDKLKEYVKKRCFNHRNVKYEQILDALPLPLNYNARDFLSDDYIVNNRLYFPYLHSKANILTALYKLFPKSIRVNKTLARELNLFLRVLKYDSRDMSMLDKSELQILEKMRN